MAVLSFREVTGRTLTHRFGESPTAERKFVLTLSNNAPTYAEVINAVGIFHGQSHPEAAYLTMTEASVNEGTPSPYHCEITYRYESLKPDQRDPNPLARPDVWQFSTGGAAVPALVYYDGSTKKSLVNSAGDFFGGLQTEESEVRATISANRDAFPLALAASVTNTINSSAYLGGAAHTWKCAGISGSQASEVVNGQQINYWAITTELIFRQSGWPLQLPDIGFNYLEGGKRKRAWVEDPETGERIPSANEVALNSDGSIKDPDELPSILVRRVNLESDFSLYFGSPSFG